MMTSLPVVNRASAKRPGRFRTYAMHFYRIALVTLIVVSIHHQHRWFTAQQRGDSVQPLQINQVASFFPAADSLGEWNPDHGGQTVLDGDGQSLGFVVQTSPESDRVIGFSGPINTMVAFGNDDRIIGMSILRSGDTHEHTEDVVQNEDFMTALNGMSWQQVSNASVDAVSGATLTSMSIMEGIAKRFGGANPASRFPNEITVDEVQPFFENAVSLAESNQKPSLWQVMDADGAALGSVTRTSPHADYLIGYQGPTDSLIAMDTDGRVIGAAIRHSFDNEPYVRYVKEDDYFWGIFKGFTLSEIAQLDMVDAGIEGVSGATRTSVSVAEALILATQAIEIEQPRIEAKSSLLPEFSNRDLGTALVVVLAITIAFTHLRGKRGLRVAFQIALVVYLGFINADMVSQALLVGWSQNGVAWRVAPALALLTLAAFACPVFTSRQVYCTHLCPFGALQDWLRRLPVKVKVPRVVLKALRPLPAMLLVLVVLVAMLHLPVRLVGIEPFDAFVFRIAGWATITVAVIGLLASMFVPMAYCHYGCPTGALLSYVRFHSSSGRFTLRDSFATVLTLVAVVILLL